MFRLQKLKEKWDAEGIHDMIPIDINVLEKFQKDNSIHFPYDFKEYFKFLNGTGGEYTDELYEFYSIDQIKNVSEEFKDWNGIPNYRPLLNIAEVKDLFVFANYCFNLFAYAIKLYPEPSNKNEVYVLCGNEYKKIADTFFEFLDLYFSNSIELQLNNN